ncbi:uncharacterized protein LOC112082857 [Eutrema salsugineum]|uniref:uncharacterized protein LOC112082857 n=1 Tax=Eutrema salsugineum TaxID=72664 RepID=UPI000CED7938|nr:uncharacterized protein LOC112082857 [Eutrema salsugineum]
MEPPPERSKRLHNFTLPYLRWGQQRFLRCVNLPSHSHQRSPHFPSSSSSPSPNRSISVAGVSNKKLEVVAAARPWNLRTRRAACSEPGEDSPEKIVGNEIGDELEKDEKLRFSVSLLRKEIEDDFSTMIGKRPPRRPKKRPRIVQKKLNTIFPGLWLSEEVTMDSYNVPEALET